jgi:hypothetical protein
MATPTSTAARRRETLPVDSAERVPWVANGIAAGLVGAGCFAVFFLIVDVVLGRPLWTPHALGTALFLGETAPITAQPSPLMVLAYTAVHLTFYIAFALPAAFWVLARLPVTRGPGRGALFALVLFAALEAVYVLLGQLFAPELLGMLTWGRVAAGNALAACAMSAFLFWRREHGIARSGSR